MGEVQKRRPGESRFVYTISEMRRHKFAYVMIMPYFLLFLIITFIPITMALPMGFTNFNMVNFPQWVGFSNFATLFMEDEVFLISIQNTLVFAVITGPLSYTMCFMLAWFINQLPGQLKTIFTFIFYAPTLSGNIFTTWQLIFSGDAYGLANAYLMDMGIVTRSREWLTDGNTIMGVVIIVQLWMALGAGFLAIRAGFQGIDSARYEAGAIEGIKNRAQELLYITIPAMGPQLLFAAVMQITASFAAGHVSQSLTAFPTTDYRAHSIINHAFDYGGIRFEMGYASAICFILFFSMLLANWGIKKVLGKYLDG